MVRYQKPYYDSVGHSNASSGWCLNRAIRTFVNASITLGVTT